MKPSREIKRLLLPKETDSPIKLDSNYLSTGITLLDLGAYGKINCGLAKGNIYRIAGNSGAGKTFLGRTILAEAAKNKEFDDYELIYDDVERGALMDTCKFFGQRLVDRLIPPTKTKTKTPIYSKYLSDFYEKIKRKLQSGKKLIWILDSMDALNPEKETKMGDGKAKVNSQNLRKLIDPLHESGSILIMVSQAKPDMMSMFGGEIASGGTSLLFYSTLDIWLKKFKTMKMTYKGHKVTTGVIIRATIKKNRLSGKDRTIYFPFSPSYGIDDIGANIDYLTKWQHWEKEKNQILVPEFEFSGTREGLIAHTEEKQLQRELQTIVGKVWNEVETNCTIKRTPRYN